MGEDGVHILEGKSLYPSHIICNYKEQFPRFPTVQDKRRGVNEGLPHPQEVLLIVLSWLIVEGTFPKDRQKRCNGGERSHRK